MDTRARAAFRGETDGYDIGRERLLGRHTAGHGLLRAAMAAAPEAPVMGYGPSRAAGEAFAKLVKTIDPAAKVGWALSDDPAALTTMGMLYLADPTMAPPARQRLRAGIAAYSLCGVTHTTASTAAMDQIADLLTEPLAPWDALICTSSAVLETVRVVHEAHADYLRWRLGPGVRISTPQLPVIPLGVHASDFTFSPEQQAEARAEFGLDPDEVAALYVGRYSPYGKAHPLVMFQGLEMAAQRSGVRLALVLCGWPATPGMDETYRRAAAEHAPSVRTIFADGRVAAERNRSWAAADLFVSLVDGIQETFGLTPIEAKAAGLPVVCTDWNGYRDTVRDGVDGFRIPTRAPSAGAGEAIARSFEAETISYDYYAWAAASLTTVDLAALAERLTALVGDAGLRRRMGEAGRADALARFEWAKVYADYEALWGDLTARRKAALESPEDLAWVRAAPPANPRRLDPFKAFGHYPTELLTAETVVVGTPGMTRDVVEALGRHPLFVPAIVSPAVQLAVWEIAQGSAATVAQLAERAGMTLPSAVRAVGFLAKMGALQLSEAP